MKIRALFASIALVWAAGASADIISFDLTTGNPALSGQTGDFVNITINLTNPTTAIVTFTSLCTGGSVTGTTINKSCDAGDNIFLMGDGGSVALNVNATNFTAGPVTGSNSGTGFTPGPYTTNIAAGQAENGFGKFNFTIDSDDGETHASDLISFTLIDVSGTWANASSVLTANDTTHNAVAGAHIFVNAFPANSANGAIVTGFAAGSNNPLVPPQDIPEPGVLALLGIGLFGLGASAMRRRPQA